MTDTITTPAWVELTDNGDDTYKMRLLERNTSGQAVSLSLSKTGAEHDGYYDGVLMYTGTNNVSVTISTIDAHFPVTDSSSGDGSVPAKITMTDGTVNGYATTSITASTNPNCIAHITQSYTSNILTMTFSEPAAKSDITDKVYFHVTTSTGNIVIDPDVEVDRL